MTGSVEMPIGGAVGDGAADQALRVRTRRRRRHPLLSPLVAATALLAVVATAGWGALSSAGSTQAAWSDRAYTSATITAGTWVTAPKNSCTATDQNGKSVACSVTAIRYEGWGSAGSQTRNYYIDFSASGAKSITFSVDLSTATGSGGTFTWTNAGVGSAAQFTPTSGWTCAKLPLITGKASDWHTTVYFPVYENRSGQSVMCG